MVLYCLVKKRLSNSGIVYLAVAMAPVANQVDYHITAIGVPVFQRHPPHPQHRVYVFSIHMKYWHCLPPRKLRGKSRRVEFVVRCCETQQVVDNNVHRPANGVAFEIGVVEGLCGDSLSGESGVSVHQ